MHMTTPTPLEKSFQQKNCSLILNNTDHSKIMFNNHYIAIQRHFEGSAKQLIGDDDSFKNSAISKFMESSKLKTHNKPFAILTYVKSSIPQEDFWLNATQLKMFDLFKNTKWVIPRENHVFQHETLKKIAFFEMSIYKRQHEILRYFFLQFFDFLYEPNLILTFFQKESLHDPRCST